MELLKAELKAGQAGELEQLRQIWGIRLLEDINSAAAALVLRNLACGNAADAAVAEAQAALKRMKRGG